MLWPELGSRRNIIILLWIGWYMSITIILMAHQREVPIHEEEWIPTRNNTIWFKLYWTSIMMTMVFSGFSLSLSLPPNLGYVFFFGFRCNIFCFRIVHMFSKVFWGMNGYMRRISGTIISISQQILGIYSLLKCHKNKENVLGRSSVAASSILTKMVLCTPPPSQIHLYLCCS